MTCTLCGDCKTVIYATIAIQGSICPNCYKHAKTIADWSRQAHKIIGRRESVDGLYHIQYIDATGKIVWDKKYKRWGNAIRCIQQHNEQIFGPYIGKSVNRQA